MRSIRQFLACLPSLLYVLSFVLVPHILTGQSSVNQTDGPPSGPPMQTVYVYSGSNVVGICWAHSLPSPNGVDQNRRSTRVAVSAISKANPAVVTSVGHGLTLLTLPQVTIAGATGTGWVGTGINSTYTATVIDANTFSVPVDSTGFGTLAGTITFATSAPRQTIAEWAVQVFLYSGANVVTKAWLQGSSTMGAKCTDVGSTTVGVQ